MRFLTIIIFLSISILEIFSQNEPIIIEAEMATLGSDYEVVNDGEVDYIAPKTDFLNTAYPGSADKVATFFVMFPEAGLYNLFARINVGPEGADDDSFFYGNGFGIKSPTNEFDWILCNNMNVAGYSILTDIVVDQGHTSTEIWKWVALSDYSGGETPLTFMVDSGDLEQTFEFGTREDGIQIDKIAFGKKGIYYTVDNLNKGQAGSDTIPDKEYHGPPLATGLDKFLGWFIHKDQKAMLWNTGTSLLRVMLENGSGLKEDVIPWTGLNWMKLIMLLWTMIIYINIMLWYGDPNNRIG